MATLANNNNNNNNLQLLNEEPESVAGFTLREQQMFLILQMLRNNDIDAPQQGPLTSLPSVFSISRPMHYNGGYKPGKGFYAHFRTIGNCSVGCLICLREFRTSSKIKDQNGENIKDHHLIFNFMNIGIMFKCHLNMTLNLRPPAANWVLPFGDTFTGA